MTPTSIEHHTFLLDCFLQFEKDDDSNFHMDMIAGLANMRARNYSVAEVGCVSVKSLGQGDSVS